MRFSLPILSVSSLVLSVYAADLTKPKLAEHALSCLLIINGVTSQVKIVLYVLNKIEEFIRRSHGCCVTIRPEITDDEVVAASDSLSLLTADIVAALESIQERKSLFGEDPLTYARINSLIGNLNNGTDHLLGCLLFKTPDKYLPLITGFRETVNEAFDTAKLAFDMQ